MSNYIKKNEFIEILENNGIEIDSTKDNINFERLSSSCAVIETYNYIYCVHYNTIICKFRKDDKQIVLHNGGYETVTTKENINRFLSMIYAPFKIFQKQYQWYIKDSSNDIKEFYNNIHLYK